MAGHYDKVELPLEANRGQVSENPLDVQALARLRKHSPGGIHATKSTSMAQLPSPMQKLAGAAAYVQHGSCRHHKREIEPEVVPLFPRTERVVQRSERSVFELVVGHALKPAPTTSRLTSAFRRTLRS